MTEDAGEREEAAGGGGTTRRAFLGLLAGTGALSLGGCSALPWMEGASTSTSPPAASTPITALGPEPSSFVPPAPAVQPPVGADPLVLNADVCVVGGGAAGMAAATAAARMGARTVLLEESHVLGGNVTRGLVNLDKISWGAGPMVGGYFEKIIRKLEENGEAIYPSPETQYSVPAELDALRHLALVTCQEAGATVRLGAAAAWVEKAAGDSRLIKAVWAREQGRLLKVQASLFLDCTGDGHLGYQAGNGYWLGDRTHGQIQGQTLIFYAAPVDFEALTAYAASEEGNLANSYQVIGLKSFMDGFRKTHHVPGRPQRGTLINRNIEDGKVSISVSEIYGNHLEPGNLPQIMQDLQEQNRQIHAAMRRELPGFENSRILRMAERPYLREGRRLVGHYQLTAEDILAGVKPPDSIARGWYPIDLHVAYAGGPIHVGAAPGGDWYCIPYRCLVARDIDNLLMAGRCISVTHEALGSTRVSPLSMALGQAAGIAAALAVAAKVRPADLPADMLQEEVVTYGGLI